MPFESNLAFREKRRSRTQIFSSLLSFPESLRLRKTKPESNNKHRNSSGEPVIRSPSVRSGADEGTRKSSSKQVPKSIALLKETRDNTPSLDRAILEGCGCGIAVDTAHGDSKESTASQELLVGLAETGPQLKGNEHHIVGDKGPLPAPTVRGNPEDDSSHGPEHENKGDAPSDVSNGLVEFRGQLSGGQGDGEEIERIPCPTKESNLEAVSYRASISPFYY